MGENKKGTGNYNSAWAAFDGNMMAFGYGGMPSGFEQGFGGFGNSFDQGFGGDFDQGLEGGFDQNLGMDFSQGFDAFGQSVGNMGYGCKGGQKSCSCGCNNSQQNCGYGYGCGNPFEAPDVDESMEGEDEWRGLAYTLANETCLQSPETFSAALEQYGIDADYDEVAKNLNNYRALILDIIYGISE